MARLSVTFAQKSETTLRELHKRGTMTDRFEELENLFQEFGTRYPTLYHLESKKTELESDLQEAIQTTEMLRKGRTADRLNAELYSHLMNVFYDDHRQIDNDSRTGRISESTRARIKDLLDEAEGSSLIIEYVITLIDEMIENLGGHHVEYMSD